MTGVTTGQTSLATATDSDDTETFLTSPLTTDLQALANLFESATGHDHTGAGKGKPIGVGGLGAGAATGTALGPELPVRIATIGPLGVATASFDFTAIPATFSHLLLEIMGRGDGANVSNSVLVRFNNDSGANYNRHYSSFTGAGATAQTEGVAQTSLYIGEFTGANASAGYVGYSVLFIAHYAGTTFNKHAKFQGGVTTPNGAGTSSYAAGQGMWASATAINRITVLPPGASVNWIAGSIATLYGLP